MSVVLSVNVNKVALIRNSRGANYPDLVKFALDCEQYGAEGITIHPRPDQRHARYSDIEALKNAISVELNVEGNPDKTFLSHVIQHKPAQCTLVPDAAGAITSDAGWDTVTHYHFLKEICDELRQNGIRSSIFIDPNARMVEGAKKCGADRIELYTGEYAHQYHSSRESVIQPFIETADLAHEIGLEINAGHDLNLDNLAYFKSKIKNLVEVSIGHAIIVDALYFGIENTIKQYRNLLK